MNILQGLGDPLLGHRWTGEPVLTQALRVDDVLARLHRHVLAHLAGVAGGQLGVLNMVRNSILVNRYSFEIKTVEKLLFLDFVERS